MKRHLDEPRGRAKQGRSPPLPFPKGWGSCRTWPWGVQALPSPCPCPAAAPWPPVPPPAASSPLPIPIAIGRSALYKGQIVWGQRRKKSE